MSDTVGRITQLTTVAAPPARAVSVSPRAVEIVSAIEARVRPTICQTYSSDGRQSVEGRITVEDFEMLVILAAGAPPKGMPV